MSRRRTVPGAVQGRASACLWLHPGSRRLLLLELAGTYLLSHSCFLLSMIQHLLADDLGSETKAYMSSVDFTSL